MKKLLLIVLITFTLSLYSQQCDNLKGYDKFQIGDSYFEFKDEISFMTKDDEAKSYRYNGLTKQLLGFKIQSIFLEFTRNILSKITLNMGTLGDENTYNSKEEATGNGALFVKELGNFFGKQPQNALSFKDGYMFIWNCDYLEIAVIPKYDNTHGVMDVGVVITKNPK